MRPPKILSLFLILFSAGITQAQTHGKDLYVEYEMQFDINLPELGTMNKLLSNFIQKYQYVYSNGISCFKHVSERSLDPSMPGTFKSRGRTTYIDFTHRYRYEQHDVHLDWVARDTLLFERKWKMHFNETKVIQGYTCIKATAADNDSGETVWFCKDLPIPDGPIGYQGLPGLVLAVENAKINYTAVKVDAAYISDPIVLPMSAVYMTKEAFNEKLMSRN